MSSVVRVRLRNFAQSEPLLGTTAGGGKLEITIRGTLSDLGTRAAPLRAEFGGRWRSKEEVAIKMPSAIRQTLITTTVATACALVGALVGPVPERFPEVGGLDGVRIGEVPTVRATFNAPGNSFLDADPAGH